MLVGSIPTQCICDDGHQGAHVGKAGPQSVSNRDMGRVQLFGARSPETLAGVVQVPDVEVADLGPLGCGDADDGLGRTGKGSPAADRKNDGGDGYAR